MAYTFGISALSGSALQFAKHSPHGVVATLALPLFLAANGLIAFIFLRTIVWASAMLHPSRGRQPLV